MGETSITKTPIDGVIVVIVDESQLEEVRIPTLLEGAGWRMRKGEFRKSQRGRGSELGTEG